MPDTARTPEEQMMMGELLAANRATAEAVRALSQESRSHAEAMATVHSNLQTVSTTVAQLVRVVHDGYGESDSLLTRTRLLEEGLAEVRRLLQSNAHDLGDKAVREEMVELLDSIDERLKELERSRQRAAQRTSGEEAMRKTIWRMLEIIAWVLTTAIAAWAAWASWK